VAEAGAQQRVARERAARQNGKRKKEKTGLSHGVLLREGRAAQFALEFELQIKEEIAVVLGMRLARDAAGHLFASLDSENRVKVQNSLLPVRVAAVRSRGEADALVAVGKEDVKVQYQR
jgi:hypothetical protein